jgi:flotillin
MMGVVIMAAVGIVVVFCVFVLVYASRYTKVGPNEVLVISGRRRRMIGPDGTPQTVGYRIVKGEGHLSGLCSKRPKSSPWSS